MTDERIAQVLDLDRIGDLLTCPSTRPVVEAFVQDIEEKQRKEEGGLDDLRQRRDEAKAELAGLDEAVKDIISTEREIIAGFLKKRFASLDGPLYMVVPHIGDARKCGWCDDEGMIELHSPDGQTIRRPCSCRHDYEISYEVHPADILEVRWNHMVMNVPEEDQPVETHEVVWDRVDDVDFSDADGVLYNRDFDRRAYTDVEIAKKAIEERRNVRR